MSIQLASTMAILFAPVGANGFQVHLGHPHPNAVAATLSSQQATCLQARSQRKADAKNPANGYQGSLGPYGRLLHDSDSDAEFLQLCQMICSWTQTHTHTHISGILVVSVSLTELLHFRHSHFNANFL